MSKIKVFTAAMAQKACKENEMYDKDAALQYAFDTIKDAAERGKHAVNLFAKYFAGESVIRMQAYRDVCQKLEELGYGVYVRFVADDAGVFDGEPHTVISWVTAPYAK